MTDLDKAKIILAATNNGADLPEHQKIIISAAKRDTLGQNTGVRMVFEDMYEQCQKSTEIMIPENNS
jgi:hypothetical protein